MNLKRSSQGLRVHRRLRREKKKVHGQLDGHVFKGFSHVTLVKHMRRFLCTKHFVNIAAHLKYIMDFVF